MLKSREHPHLRLHQVGEWWAECCGQEITHLWRWQEPAGELIEEAYQHKQF